MAGYAFGVRHGYRSVLTLDADLQHLPEEIPRFFALDNGRRIIIGTRYMDPTVMPLDRWLTNNLTSMIVSVFSAQRVRDSQSGFRLIPSAVLAQIPLATVGTTSNRNCCSRPAPCGTRSPRCRSRQSTRDRRRS